MITTDRNVGFMTHLTTEVKEGIRREAARRGVSMSELAYNIFLDWLEHAPFEQVEKVRSNKRAEVEVLPGIPGHQHSFDAAGRVTCGCNLTLPFSEDK